MQQDLQDLMPSAHILLCCSQDHTNWPKPNQNKGVWNQDQTRTPGVQDKIQSSSLAGFSSVIVSVQPWLYWSCPKSLVWPVWDQDQKKSHRIQDKAKTNCVLWTMHHSPCQQLKGTYSICLKALCWAWLQVATIIHHSLSIANKVLSTQTFSSTLIHFFCTRC